MIPSARVQSSSGSVFWLMLPVRSWADLFPRKRSLISVAGQEAGRKGELGGRAVASAASAHKQRRFSGGGKVTTELQVPWQTAARVFCGRAA